MNGFLIQYMKAERTTMRGKVKLLIVFIHNGRKKPNILIFWMNNEPVYEVS